MVAIAVEFSAMEKCRNGRECFTVGWARNESIETIEQCRSIAKCESLVYSARRTIFSPENASTDSFLVTSGVVGLYYGSSHSDLLFMLAYPGDMVDKCTPDPRHPGIISGRSLTNCTAYRLPHATFRDPARARLAAIAWMQACARRQLARRTALIVEQMQLEPVDRLMKFMNELALVIGKSVKEGVEIPLLLKDEEFATLLGVSLRHFKRIKHLLDNSGRGRFVSKHTFILHEHKFDVTVSA